MAFLDRILGTPSERFLKSHDDKVVAINNQEALFSTLKDDEIKHKSEALKKRVQAGESLDEVLVPAFALVREAAKRTLGQRHYDVQLLGGLALHSGRIAEMRTGEGKTLVATAPAYLNALSGQGVHVVTVNDYLTRRDATWMGQVYNALGLSVGCITQDAAYVYDASFDPTTSEGTEATDSTQVFKIHHKFLRPIERREAYQLDIVYATNNTIGFDYLRDNLAYSKTQIVQRPFNYAIVDEVDSILIDEARTPLIISSADARSSELYKTFAKIVPQLASEKDYVLDEKLKSVVLTDAGIAKVEKVLGIGNLYAEGDTEKIFHLEQALRARVLYKRDHQYVVRENKVVIVDEFTGRLMPDRRFSEGIHQALEAKENVPIQEESKTLATITFQNLFRKYPKLSGMTGTAETSDEELFKVYGVEVVVIPTHRKMIRQDNPDKIYQNEAGKLRAIVKEVAARYEKGQPVLIGTVSIEKNEVISKALERAKVPHEILNAKNHEREGAIIAQAGRRGAVTVATNMAGRGVDIVLGGNPPDKTAATTVKDLGGLFVLGTERHEARRIDNQLRGRSGRQGDPGESQFYVSMEDDLMRVFGSDRAKNLMARMGLAEDEPIVNGLINKALEKAQEKIEGFNFDTRKHILEYDEVLNKQREAIYNQRREILLDKDDQAVEQNILEMVQLVSTGLVAAAAHGDRPGDWNINELKQFWHNVFPADFKGFAEPELSTQLISNPSDAPEAPAALVAYFKTVFTRALTSRAEVLGKEVLFSGLRALILSSIDSFWTAHLDSMGHLRESVRLRAYGQQDPLVEYRREGVKMFQELEVSIAQQVLSVALKIAPVAAAPQPPQAASVMLGESKALPLLGQKTSQNKGAVGRNDPCPCGNGKKYKKCHGAGI